LNNPNHPNNQGITNAIKRGSTNTPSHPSSPNDALDQLRDQIDAVDDQLAKLFLQRMNLARQIGTVKKDAQISIEHTAREEHVLLRITEGCSLQQAQELHQLYQRIFEISRAAQG